MQEAAKKSKLTHAQYFALEEKSETRHEYYQGNIFDLAGGSLNHAGIISNFIRNCRFSSTDENCRIFSSDVRVFIESADLFTYPDILVICGEPQFYKKRDDTILNPVLIAEVLSESTKNYDRGEKFFFYRQIPSLRHYILIDQYSPHVEYFRLGEDGHWVLSEFSRLNDRLQISAPDLNLSLRELYLNIVFEKKKKGRRNR